MNKTEFKVTIICISKSYTCTLTHNFENIYRVRHFLNDKKVNQILGLSVSFILMSFSKGVVFKGKTLG